jgi:2-hydroxy-3-keto-5-methylthiopentenyl-1-phosphate phosphatase
MPLRYCNKKTLPLRRTPDRSPDIPLQDLASSNFMVFFDFDNTITSFDVLDGVIEQFSINRDWIEFEEAWKVGDIGSKECLKGQLRSVRATKQTISDYLATVPIDQHFKKLLSLLKETGIYPVILSDSFSFFINYILRHNDIHGVPVYSNKIRFHEDSLIPSFPYTNSLCSHCAHCKTTNLPNNGKQTVYIGDGLSDVCPANHSDIVFAKATLLDYFLKSQRSCLAFDDLGDIYNYFREHLNDAPSEKIYNSITVAQR